jgi:glycerophosphoryl diester phosphodiesterase
MVLAALPPTAARHPQVTIVAHRGLAAGVPENTLAAFRQSIERGLKVIELDLRITKDRRIVILHDATLDRTTDCSGRLGELTLARIKVCDAGAGERVPSLAEALSFIGDKPVRLLLDIKPGTPLDRVMREIREHRAETKVILGLRRPKDIARVRRELPGTTTLGFMPQPGDAPAFAHAGANIIRLWSDWVEADPGHVARTGALGAEVWIMVGRRLPDKEREWRGLHTRMIATGAQGLITDRPELISAP